jgi:hypothetical protein
MARVAEINYSKGWLEVKIINSNGTRQILNEEVDSLNIGGFVVNQALERKSENG